MSDPPEDDPPEVVDDPPEDVDGELDDAPESEAILPEPPDPSKPMPASSPSPSSPSPSSNSPSSKSPHSAPLELVEEAIELVRPSRTSVEEPLEEPVEERGRPSMLDTDPPPPDPDADEDARRSLVDVLRRPSLTDDPRRKRRHALLYVQRLSKVYTASRGWFRGPELVQALDNVSFYVRRRETFGLIGESGSGKSTLGRCILRLTEPTVGRVIFDGKDVTSMRRSEMRSMRQRMQIVFQNPFSSLNPNMMAREIVREGIDIFDLAESPRDADDRATQLLERVGIDGPMVTRYPHEFSGGQRQRIAIARALAVGPELIVLDEPTSALDLSVQAQVLNLLQDLQEELELSQLFISHDLRVVQYVAHRIGVMYRGRIIELGPSDAVAKRRYHPYTRALFGAMPSPTPTERKSLQLVVHGDGDDGPPRNGCAFFHHCPNAEPGVCDESVPELNEVVRGAHHRVACWHPNVQA
jgi:peptide/nickel transport system ATP-binding protein